MECDAQDEGTVGPQFQDDSIETPTWLREEVVSAGCKRG